MYETREVDAVNVITAWSQSERLQHRTSDSRRKHDGNQHLQSSLWNLPAHNSSTRLLQQDYNCYFVSWYPFSYHNQVKGMSEFTDSTYELYEATYFLKSYQEFHLCKPCRSPDCILLLDEMLCVCIYCYHRCNKMNYLDFRETRDTKHNNSVTIDIINDKRRDDTWQGNCRMLSTRYWYDFQSPATICPITGNTWNE